MTQQSCRDCRILAILQNSSIIAVLRDIVGIFVYNRQESHRVARIMCKASATPPRAYFPFDVVAAEDAREFRRNTTLAPLDGIFEVDVRKSATPQEVEYYAELIGRIQAELNIAMVELKEHTRSNFDVQSNEFWHSVTTAGNIVSQYYQRGLSENREYMLEPCTAVVGSRVILCFELYFNRSNHIVYRDIVTSIHATLGEVIADFNLVQGFAADVSYTFTTHTEEQGWELRLIPTSIMSMPLGRLLRLPVIQESNNADFFRLSPQDVEEDECSGVLS